MNYMEIAIEQAKKSTRDVPVGAVIVKDGKIIAQACNKKEETNDVTSHAEIAAIRKAEKLLNNWRLDECVMYVTLEPCPMCAWAIIQSRIKSLYFGSYDSNYGSFLSAVDLRNLSSSKLEVWGGIMENECNRLLEEFFEKIRK